MNNTALLQHVTDILEKTPHSVSVKDLQRLLAEPKYNLRPNKTSLYRMMERLKQENVVQEVLTEGSGVFYELTKSPQHYHFICQECGVIRCAEDISIETNIHRLQHKLRGRGFMIQGHQLSFSGLCPDCCPD